jgi:hypothetical protein
MVQRQERELRTTAKPLISSSSDGTSTKPVQAVDSSLRPAVPVGRSLLQPKVAGDVPPGLSITSPPSIGCSRNNGGELLEHLV